MIPARAAPRTRCQRARERGGATIGTVAGVAVFLVLLLFALQVLVTLLTTSTVIAAGQDAARRVASMRVDHSDPVARAAAVRIAERHLRDALGAVGDRAALEWTFADGSVHLHISAETPAILPSNVMSTTDMRRIDRTIRVRIESAER